MIHYSCDRCRCEIDPQDDLRYVVKIEIQATMDPQMDSTEPDDDRDHLAEIEEIISELSDESMETIGEDIYQKRSFDLCPSCYRQFIKNPLGREQKASMGFSKN
ncbi:MAG: hypothetical protein ACO1RA_16965 [Planctomycetaceae bacterium]